MESTVPTTSAPASRPPVAPTPRPEAADDRAAPLVEDDLLIEDVSIDGMCGVY
jgi:mycofactocin precursor